MEWMNRAGKPAQPNNSNNVSGVGVSQPSHVSSNNNGHRSTGSKKINKFSFHTLASLAILTCVAIIILAVVALSVLVKNKSEERFVDTTKTQAVFLNSGQVYFGKIININDKYLRLVDIYYLQVNQQVQPGEDNQNAQQNVSLAKLGCEIHRPQDAMTISKDQIIFWENLKEDTDQRTVPGAIANNKKTNPNGQDCAAPAQQESNGQGQESQQTPAQQEEQDQPATNNESTTP